ncbi:hypothetical protein V1478_003988 [Vespula squamosa]|uniref:Uncharacterized protein n=1 Tax=Vespula squamosa TaxID=30214 RepID=A0ABD2BNZ3_VESSQ
MAKEDEGFLVETSLNRYTWVEIHKNEMEQKQKRRIRPLRIFVRSWWSFRATARSSSWLPQDTGAPPPAQKDTTPFLWCATVRLIITFTISSSSLLFLIFSQTIP